MTISTKIARKSGVLKRRVRILINLIDEGSYEKAHAQFGSELKQQVSPAQLEQVWNGVEDQNGEFQSISKLKVRTQKGTDIVTGQITLEHGRAEIITAFRDKTIIGFQVHQLGPKWSGPSYVNESTFTEQNITIQATDTCSLDGTVTVPYNTTQAPGIVLVHGQGPSDRDGTVGPNKPYKDLAWGLASRGIAVLRYDKRTQVCNPNLAEITINEAVTDDALAAIETLRKSPNVADNSIFVVGHSIGATLAPRIATRDGNLAGTGMLAPLARSAADAIDDQTQYLATRDGVVTEAEEQQLKLVDQITKQIRSLNFPDDKVVYLGGDEYWSSLQRYEALETAKCLPIPQLLLQGERDYQVTIEDDFRHWHAILGGKSNVSFEQYPKLNHLFMPGTGKSGPEEYRKQNHVAEQVVLDIASFVKKIVSAD
ncbi:alpha/beta fold hydrolase [Haladaptatus sp. CMAA 1911]|uniref:alpha/beta hydrolase n=1 Tax=unclassified Haladaptatus TaxID=2622732 RepID=UPI0037546BBB